jgi:hypothetical protein
LVKTLASRRGWGWFQLFMQRLEEGVEKAEELAEMKTEDEEKSLQPDR